MLTIQQIPAGTFHCEIPTPDAWPGWLKKSAVAVETFEYRGETHLFAVAKRDFTEQAKDFHGFVAYIQGYILVSEDVYPAFRPYYALHEFVEMTELAGQKQRCLKALEVELAHVPERIFTPYTFSRWVFFARLLEFHERQGNIDSDDLAEMSATFQFLTDHFQDRPEQELPHIP